MIEDSNKKFFSWGIFKGSLVVAITLVFICLMCSSCEFFRKLDKSSTTNRNDSANVKKETEVSSSVDTSKTKSASTKETVYYPQPIIIKGEDGKPYPVFVPQTVKETGTEEKQNFNFDNYRRDLLDSIRIAQLESQLNKKSETEGSILGMGFWVGVSILGVVLLAIILVLVKSVNQLTSLKSLITK